MSRQVAKMLTKICKRCGKEFQCKDTNTDRNKLYCKQKCTPTTKTVTKNCEMCGVEFTSEQKITAKEVKYCSNVCTGRAMNSIHQNKQNVIKCDFCGTECISNTPSQKCCSRKCSALLWRQNNPEKAAATYARYRKTESNRLSKNKWASNNRQAGYDRNKERYHSDEEYNIKTKIRRRICMSIKAQHTKKTDKSMGLLGATYDVLKEHIQKQFTEGMTWELVMSGEIHLDHILPCSSFNLLEESEQRKCFHYTNLQPLFSRQNLQKSDKILHHMIWHDDTGWENLGLLGEGK